MTPENTDPCHSTCPIRTAKALDLGLIVRLDATDADRWGENQWRTEIRGGRVWLDQEGLVVASVQRLEVATPPSVECELHRLVVAGEARRQGYGRRMLQCLLRRMPGRWLLEVARRNHPAFALYENVGFEPVGTRLNYYRNGDDAVLMTRQPV